MTIYKIKRKLEESATPYGGGPRSITGGVIRVTRWKIVGYIEEKADADMFVRVYQLKYPLLTIRIEPLEVHGEPGMEAEAERAEDEDAKINPAGGKDEPPIQ